MTETQGKSILVQVSVRFELVRVRVIGSRLYSDYTLGIPLEKKVSDEVEEGTWHVSISYPLSLQDLFPLLFMDLTL